MTAGPSDAGAAEEESHSPVPVRSPWVVCNAAFAVWLLSSTLDDAALLRAAMASLLVFVVPGLAWSGRRGGGDFVARAFLAITRSLAVLIGGSALFLAIGREPTPGAFVAYLFAATNLGLFVTGRRNPAMVAPVPSTIQPVACAVLAYLVLAYAAARLPIVTDHDDEVPGAAYGLVTRFEPLLAYNSGVWHYFAHPPLSVAWIGYQNLLNGTLGDIEFYYRSARAIDVLAASHPGDARMAARSSSGEGPDFEFVRSGGRLFALEPGGVAEFPSLAKLAVHVSDRERRWFNDHPRLTADVRASNVFLGALTAAMIFAWLRSAMVPGAAAWAAALAYALSPGILVRSLSGGHTAAENLSVLFVAYFASMDDASGRRFGRAIPALSGVVAAWVTQKAIVLMIALCLARLRRPGGGDGEPLALSTRVLRPDVIGYAAGTVLFWAYGLSIDWDSFVFTHLYEHYWEMSFSGGYVAFSNPSTPRVWTDAIIELPALVMLPLTVWVAWNSPHRSGERLFVYWLVTAGVIYSGVEAQQSKHLMQMGPAVVMLAAVAAARSPHRWMRRALRLGLWACVAYGAWFLASLMSDFAWYVPLDGW